MNMLVSPAALQRIALKHFKQQAGAASRGVHLLARGHVAGTHGSFFILTTLAHAHATSCRLCKIAMLFRESEVGVNSGRIVVSAEAKVFIHAIGINFLPRIHLPLGVPGTLELAESLYQFRAIHLDQKLTSGLAIAMLAGKRATQADYQVRRFLHEASKLFDPFCG